MPSDLILLIEKIKFKSNYEIKINPWNWNCEVWSKRGVREHEFETEKELVAFLNGIYYTLVDYDTYKV